MRKLIKDDIFKSGEAKYRRVERYFAKKKKPKSCAAIKMVSNPARSLGQFTNLL